MSSFPRVQVRPSSDRDERSEAQMHDGDRVWGGSVGQSCEPMCKNRMGAAAKLGERASDREALVIKAKRCKSSVRAVKVRFSDPRLHARKGDGRARALLAGDRPMPVRRVMMPTQTERQPSRAGSSDVDGSADPAGTAASAAAVDRPRLQRTQPRLLTAQEHARRGQSHRGVRPVR